ncbi:hypothetical protein SGPA1_12377 [Streptomyces misionensis JCM 4497]
MTVRHTRGGRTDEFRSGGHARPDPGHALGYPPRETGAPVPHRRPSPSPLSGRAAALSYLS